jgi:hypothetical protein
MAQRRIGHFPGQATRSAPTLQPFVANQSPPPVTEIDIEDHDYGFCSTPITESPKLWCDVA